MGGGLPFPLSPSAARSGRKKPRQSPWAAWQKLRVSASRARGSGAAAAAAHQMPSLFRAAGSAEATARVPVKFSHQQPEVPAYALEDVGHKSISQTST